MASSSASCICVASWLLRAPCWRDQASLAVAVVVVLLVLLLLLLLSSSLSFFLLLSVSFSYCCTLVIALVAFCLLILLKRLIHAKTTHFITVKSPSLSDPYDSVDHYQVVWVDYFRTSGGGIPAIPNQPKSKGHVWMMWWCVKIRSKIHCVFQHIFSIKNWIIIFWCIPIFRHTQKHISDWWVLPRYIPIISPLKKMNTSHEIPQIHG